MLYLDSKLDPKKAKYKIFIYTSKSKKYYKNADKGFNFSRFLGLSPNGIWGKEWGARITHKGITDWEIFLPFP